MEYRKQILLVDDEEILLRLFAKHLTNIGYEVETANSGEQALQLLKIKRFNLIITDMAMPEITGFDILIEAKSISPETEVIIFTGSGNMDSYIEAMNLGAFAFLTKPIDFSKLVETIDKAFSRLNFSGIYAENLKEEGMIQAKENNLPKYLEMVIEGKQPDPSPLLKKKSFLN